ncbi:MAG: DUF2279 domain-containing protein [Bacteroidia bacterium]|nr:DUF2279 domain-containing protein [Bacteroidia bacterium]
MYFFSGVTAVTYTGTMLMLNELWYKNYSHSSFHFFNDSKEWLQMDKSGHAYSTYYLSSALISGFEWSGFRHNKSVVIGSGIAFIAMSGIEVFDGYSSKWGASLSDLSANFGGSVLYASQELLFKKQICRLKFSYHPTNWPVYRPDALGENDFQSVIKDYNGQTYWLSCNLKSITGINKMPGWLNISLGYSGESMLGGNDNNDITIEAVIPPPDRYCQYYLSLDADLTQIKVKSKVLKSVFKALNCLKVPFPALVYEQNKLKFSSLYF